MLEFSQYTHVMQMEKCVIVCNVKTGSYMRLPRDYYNVLKDLRLDETKICSSVDLQKLLNNLIKIGCVEEKSKIKEEQEQIKMIYFSITNKCNLKCVHCCTGATSNYSEELSIEDIYCIINKIITLNPKTLCLTGGEPMMRKDFFDILKFSRENFSGRIVLSTNGTLIYPDNIEYIMSHVDNISISLDGCDEESCSIIRGKGIFTKCCKTIELLHSYGFKDISISMLVTKYTFEKREKFEKLCERYEATPIFRTLEPLGRGEKIYQDLKVDMIGDDKDILIGCRACFPGFRELHINYNGEVYPCGGLVGLDKFTVANAMDEDFVAKMQKVWKENELSCISPYRSWNCNLCKSCSIQLFCPLCLGEKYVLLNQGNLEKEFCSIYREKIAKALEDELYG